MITECTNFPLFRLRVSLHSQSGQNKDIAIVRVPLHSTLSVSSRIFDEFESHFFFPGQPMY
jgi:hypothetical protein